MKRSRRVILTMMGSGAIGTISLGFIERRDCGSGFQREMMRGRDGQPIVSCQAVTYGGFGRVAHHLHGHGHGHGHGGG